MFAHTSTTSKKTGKSGNKSSTRSSNTLTRYRAKRDFQKTAEPSGLVRAAGCSYCVQKHDASHLHYDFRLELDGVLLSWAVPKGPSLDPSVKRLAMEVEPHPVEYGGFEGTIPQGEYGGGTVLLWDRGTWEPIEDARKGLKSGTLHFVLHGEKLKGRWRLQRSRAGSPKKPQWLLIKSKDRFAESAPYDILDDEPLSVVSRRDLPEISLGRDGWTKTGGRSRGKRINSAIGEAAVKDWPPSGAIAAKIPKKISPQLATLVDAIPSETGWLHELKLDGYRLLAFKDGNKVRVVSRNGKDWTKKLPRIRDSVAALAIPSAVLDGELVAFDSAGRTDFQLLQNLMKADPSQLQYVGFDLPWFDGFDLKSCPLIERKERLRQILTAAPTSKNLRFGDHLAHKGDAVLEHACRLGAEGIVSKRVDSPYVEARSRTWVKTKCVSLQELVIGGYTLPQGSRTSFGAILVGYYENGKLQYAGKVGTGFDRSLLKDMFRQMSALRRPSSAFVHPPRGAAARGVTWIEPKLVCQVRFTGWTEDNALRHPVFEGLRVDKSAADVMREIPKKNADRLGPATPQARKKRPNSASTAPAPKKGSDIDFRGVKITHPDRVIFPEIPLTKGQIAEYYDLVAELMLPHLKERPLMALRCPQGTANTCFHQKHWEHSPPGMDSVPIAEADGQNAYPVVRRERDIIALCQFNVIEFHTWGCNINRLDRADRVIFDLDPGPGVSQKAVADAARTLRTLLKRMELVSFVKTSGGKGLHVVAPLTGNANADAVTAFAESVSRALSDKHPDRYVANMKKSLRTNRIYVDYLRNSQGATCVSAYSVRAREGAPVSMPISWESLAQSEIANTWTVPALLKKPNKIPRGAWLEYFTLKQTLPNGKITL